MTKTLSKHGNSHALVIEKPLLEALGITPETPLQISVSGQSLVISRADVGIGKEGVRNTTKRMRERYGQALKKLAE